ncbi:LytR C-terminal domain-containing protein [Streptacidiphilus monticola]
MIGVGTFQLVEIFGGGKKKNVAAGCAHVAADAAGSAGASASASPSALPSPSAITVNVYNATTRTGLAGNTANQLKARGFKIGKIGNAPATLDHKVTTTGEIIGGAASKP